MLNRTLLAGHPAVAAWGELSGRPIAIDPTHIEVLRQGRKSATYRLVGAGPGGTPIIARRARTAKALILRTLYSKMLSRLPIAAARYCAFRAESPGFAWVFLEECGGGRP